MYAGHSRDVQPAFRFGGRYHCSSVHRLTLHRVKEEILSNPLNDHVEIENRSQLDPTASTIAPADIFYFNGRNWIKDKGSLSNELLGKGTGSTWQMPGIT